MLPFAHSVLVLQLGFGLQDFFFMFQRDIIIGAPFSKCVSYYSKPLRTVP